MSKQLIFSLLVVLAFCIAIVEYIPEARLVVLLEHLVFDAIAVITGLSIAVVGIFLGSISSIYLSIYRIVKSRKKKKVLADQDVEMIKAGLDPVVEELKENTVFSIIVFGVTILLFFVKEIDFPYVYWCFSPEFFSKNQCVHTLILLGNAMIFWAIYDSTLTIFRIVDIFKLVKDK